MAELFVHYPSQPDELVGISAQMIRAAGDMDSTVGEVRAGMVRADDAVDGDLALPMATAPCQVIRNGVNVADAARLASGSVMFFAQAVTTYNMGVDRLNAQVTDHDMHSPTPDAVIKLDRLRREEAELEAALDAAAERIAAMLERGPNAAVLAFLRKHGYLVSPAQLQQTVAGMPSGGDPQAMARWWASLTLAQRAAVMAAYPEWLGNTDGLPAEVRDEANRLTMADDLEQLEAKERNGTLTELEEGALANIRNIMKNIADRESRTDPITGENIHAQLYVYDPYAFNGDGRFAIAAGNLDEAEHIAVTVPGIGNDATGRDATSSLNIYDESRLASGDDVAVLDWMGYDSPTGTDIPGVATQVRAREGAELLASDVAGLRASRSDDPAHLTVISHSYGSTTSGIAASEYGLDADDLVLNGSPGVPVDDAGELTTGHDHTWVGSNSRDPVTWLGQEGAVDPFDTLGSDPAEDDFGARRVQAEYTDRGRIPADIRNHLHYYDRNSESLYNIAAITTEQYTQVSSAGHRTDPWYDEPQDPELDREPREIRHGG